jgi:DNA-binding NtrC family response regulator
MAAERRIDEKMQATLLLVEDEESLRFSLGRFLHARGYTVLAAESSGRARERLAAARPDAAIVDYSLPDGTGLELLRQLKRLDPEMPVLLLTGHGSIPLAVQAIQEGADQFLTKPVELESLALLLERFLENRRARQRALADESRATRAPADPFLGESLQIRQLARQAQRVLGSTSPVLLCGETGSGKGVLAHWLHRNGPRRKEAFVEINCASLSRELLESELFWHEKGAYTGALTAKPGLIEIAHRGTLFLDEIGDMEVSVQPKLLKVLEEKKFRRLGEVKERQVDVRLIAATRQDLQEAIETNAFRDDLYYRISSLQLFVPALRERGRDIAFLADHLLDRLTAELGLPLRTLTPEALSALMGYSWPGNVRELRNVLERALLLSDPGERLGQEEVTAVLEAGSRSWRSGPSANLRLEEAEKAHIRFVLARNGGDVRRTASVLGLSRSALYERLKKHGLSGL